MSDEKTSRDVASLAALALAHPERIKIEEIKTLAASCLTQAPDREIKGLPVSGYKPTQPPEAIAAVNVFKDLEERALRHIDVLSNGDGALGVDGRLLAVGRTQLQGAFMFLARAIFQPQRVTLPEDE